MQRNQIAQKLGRKGFMPPNPIRTMPWKPNVPGMPNIGGGDGMNKISPLPRPNPAPSFPVSPSPIPSPSIPVRRGGTFPQPIGGNFKMPEPGDRGISMPTPIAKSMPTRPSGELPPIGGGANQIVKQFRPASPDVVEKKFVGSFKKGGKIKETGYAKVHKGEEVLTKEESMAKKLKKNK